MTELISTLKCNRLNEEYFKRRLEVKAFSWTMIGPIYSNLRKCLKSLFGALPDCQIWQFPTGFTRVSNWIWPSKPAIVGFSDTL